MDNKEKSLKEVIVDKESQERNNYIKPYILFNFGREIATILANAYGADSAATKLTMCKVILDCKLKDEAKIKFIGDIMTRPRKERMAISRKLFKLLQEEEDGKK